MAADFMADRCAGAVEPLSHAVAGGGAVHYFARGSRDGGFPSPQLLMPRRAAESRRFTAVPRRRLVLFVATLAAHAALRAVEPKPVAVVGTLDAPLPAPTLRTLSLGEPQALSQILTLYLQAFDNQPGISIPFSALDYTRVMAWLETALAL